jgi:threonyl-tRNA synthetase
LVCQAKLLFEGRFEVTEDKHVRYEDSELYKIRHSISHVMAHAVSEMFPDAKIAIGPPTADGFYYDFDLPRALTPDDLETIEQRMREIVREGHTFVRRVVNAAEARELFARQPFKLELIDSILQGGTDEYGEPLPENEEPQLTSYRMNNFEDLCRGPHVRDTNQINPDAFKLTTVSGAYWRGDIHRPMLQRIYGTAWSTREELAEYLERVEQAKKRDHRTLGKALDLFSTSEAVGPGLILWHPKGGMVRYLAERFSQEAHLLNGYDWVYTPHIGRAELWETSGHLDFFRDTMYQPIDVDGEDFYLKPMSCPFHIQIYKSGQVSYRDLPKRYAEYATVYRYELSGVLHGLTRVRGFTQDDAHTFCMPEQARDEIRHALRFSLYVLRTFGLEDFKAYIATRPEKKAVGSLEEWENAQAILKETVTEENIEYEIDEGGGAFYGPKIDLKVKDALGREWQLSTVQFDFNLPERFGLEYAGSDGQAHRPVMVHRALFGSAERFFGMLIEHYGGVFPLWLAPIQVVMIPISDRHNAYAMEVARQLKAHGVRVTTDISNDRMQAKIRNAEMEKIPYLLVIGDKEVSDRNLSVRSREQGTLGKMTIEAFIEMTKEQREKGKAKSIMR